ncbi:MAG: amino acid permease [Myxococcota bacterium]
MTDAQPKKMNLLMASLLVLVNMVGTGIFLLPVSMASIGSISIWGWLMATVGAGAIGLMFALLGSIQPVAGGPYGYARDSLGDYSGFQTNYVYWTANVVGNIAIATTVTGYFTEFIPALKSMQLDLYFTTGLVWLAVIINLGGPRWVGLFTSSGTLLALVPILLLLIFGWIWFDPSLFSANWNPHQLSFTHALTKSGTFALWAFMGIESASVASDVIDNPKRNIPLATLIGFCMSAVLYIGTSSLLMGLMTAEDLSNSSAPFSDAAFKMIGPAGAMIMAVCAIFKAFSSLVGWTLIVNQSAYAASKDGLFLKIYSKKDGRGIPVWNFVLSGILMTLIVLGIHSSSLTREFDKIINIAVILTVLPYLYSGVAFLSYTWNVDSTRWQRVGLSITLAIASLYCLSVVAGSDAALVRTAMIILFVSIPLYPLFSLGRKRGAKPVMRR